MVMTVLLTGWPGQGLTCLPGAAYRAPIGAAGPPRRAGGEVDYRLSRDGHGGIVLSASSGGTGIEKIVQGDGRSEATFTHTGDVVSIVATQLTIVVTRGTDSVIVNVNGGHDDQLARVRALLLGSPATRAVRTLATALEESATDAPDRMGLRLTGALLGQLDGDEGAVRRFSRELQARYGVLNRRVRTPRGDGWAAYQAGVTKACGDLETCLGSGCSVHPMRQVSSFIWIHQVERQWFAYLACSAARLGSGPAGGRDDHQSTATNGSRIHIRLPIVDSPR